MKNAHYVSYCDIFDSKMDVIRSYPGKYCKFMENGSYLLSDNKSLKMFDKDHVLKWQHNHHFHHQINLNSKGEILTIGSEVKDIGKTPVRFDFLVIYDQNGKELKKFNTYKFKGQLNKFDNTKKIKKFPNDWTKKIFPAAKWEFSHINSFYEIPKNKNSLRNKAFDSGNFIVNSKKSGIFILDSDLQNILWYKKYKYSVQSDIHDVQVMENGNLLIFNNRTSKSHHYSSIDEWDPIVNRLIWRYTGKNQSEKFISGFGGGIQEIGDNQLLFSNVNAIIPKDCKSSDVRIIDFKKNLIKKFSLKIGSKNICPIQVKKEALNSFLKENIL